MRKVYLLPNLVTTAGLASGFFAILCIFRGKHEAAVWAIVAAAVFDQLDGRVARIAKATSEFGLEYDSLSDLVSFGIAPALLIWHKFLGATGRAGQVVAFFFVACSALRLARFNIRASTVAKGVFQGLPTPVAALTMAGFVLLYSEIGFWVWLPVEPVVAVISLVLSALMVSVIPYPSFKESKETHGHSRASFGVFVIGILSIVLIAVKPEYGLFSVAGLYSAAGPLWWVFRKFSRSRLTKKSKGARDYV